MLENRKFLSIDDGEVISDELLARSSIGREVRLRTIDVSKTLEKIGFTALGIAITLDNSGIRKRGTCGRMSAVEAARALEKYLRALIEKELGRYPLFVSYVFEAHRGGTPHIHAMVFCLPLHLYKIAAILERHLSRKAVTVDVLSPSYLFKEGTGEWHLRRTTAQLIGYDVSKLLRKTASEWENGKKRVYKCDRIKDLQEGKILHSMQNYAMAKRYPNTYIEIDVFMNALLEQWNATFGVKKNRAKASSAMSPENRAPYILEKVVIFPSSIKRNRKPKKTSKKENTKPLDLDLRAKNGDRYHACNCRVFLDSKQVKALKLAAKKQRNKNGLICLIRTLFSNYQNGLMPSLSPTRAKAYLNFVYNQHQARQRARQKQARADRKLAQEYGADNIQQLYEYHKHRELWGEVKVEIFETWHTELWARGLMGDISGRACDAIVDELLDTEEYWELGLHEKYQKLGELFPKKRTAVAEKSPQKIKESEPQKVTEPCLFAPSELVPTSAEKLNKNYHLS
ncbi:hypothetical protein H7R39_01040 [Campylobacter sp. Marseille-Q3452]|uniref:Uncharacterized protein n=1 Tax=Campylobacter massiliensis TaxID=2762557 RepID=A0A842J278_9BACT|nr:hypothetical protein [Campylobacter massiliensis]MBC2881877.1 hypothetical protein [Campylobacter massiliensis]